MKLLMIGTDSTHTEAFLDGSKGLDLDIGIFSDSVVESLALSQKYAVKSCFEGIEEAIAWSDNVMILNRYGDDHLAPALSVIKAERNLFIDKPITSNYADAVYIQEMAELHKVKCMSGSPLNFSPIIQTVMSKWESLSHREMSIICPAQCNDLGDDPRLKNVFFYGIHALEIALRISPSIKVVDFNYKKLNDIEINIETDETKISIMMLDGIEEKYEISVDGLNGGLLSDIPLDGKYYKQQFQYIINGFHNTDTFLDISKSIQAVKILETIKNG